MHNNYSSNSSSMGINTGATIVECTQNLGHKPKYKYSDYFKRYKNEEVTPKELRDWYNDPTHYQFEVPLNNQGHKFE